MADLYDFFHLDLYVPVSIDSVCMSTCATQSTIYVCIYAQRMHMTQGLDSKGLAPCCQLPPTPTRALQTKEPLPLYSNPPGQIFQPPSATLSNAE